MKSTLLGLFAILAFLSSGSPAAAGERTSVVDSEGRAEISAGRTPGEARRLALDRARRAALEEVAGVDLRGSTVVYNADLINDLIMTGTGGRIVGQDILLNECGEQGGRLVCTIKIRAEVRVLDRSRDRSFQIKAAVSRPGTRSKKEVVLFKDGDEVQVRVRLDRKGYLSIFSVDQTGVVSQLFPNRYAGNSLVKGDRDFIFPDDSQREKGFTLRAMTLEGKRKSNESMMVIATTRRVRFLEDAGDRPVITDLMAELAGLDSATWAQVTRGYVILK